MFSSAPLPRRFTISLQHFLVHTKNKNQEGLARKASAKTHAFASASLDFLGKRKLAVIEHKPGPTDVDAALIACALTEKTPTGVATVDRALRSALASQDVPVIYPRTQRGLVAERFHF